jgi:uncharacterized glyoxalase superfamily protein PhnB
LGWTPRTPPSPLSVMYQIGTSLLVFIDAAYQARESGIPAIETPKGLWAQFVASKEEVHAIIDRAVAAGATITSSIRDRDLGLYSGYFADPEGNGWEIVFGPRMKVDAAGALMLG